MYKYFYKIKKNLKIITKLDLKTLDINKVMSFRELYQASLTTLAFND